MSKQLLASQYLGFITIGLVANIIGPVLPAIQSDIHMNYTQAGYILSGQFFGGLLSVWLAGRLADKIGKKRFLTVGSFILIVGLAGSVFSKSFATLFLWTLIIGVGFCVYEVGINALCADSTTSNKGAAMNFLHFFYGVGAIGGPVLATYILHATGDWRLLFGLSTLLPLLVCILLQTFEIPTANITHPQPGEKKVFSLYKNRFMWLNGLLMFVYVGIEVTMYGWIPAYWEKVSPSHTLVPSTVLPTFFWTTLTITRLLSGKIADKLGFPIYIAASCLGLVLFSLSWIVVPFITWTLFIVPVVGILLAGLFPIIMTSTIDYAPERSGEIASFIFIFASLGGFLIPSGIGGLADLMGIGKLPEFAAVLSTIMFILSVLLWKIQKQLSLAK